MQNLYQCHLVRYKTHRDSFGNEHWTIQWEAGDWRPLPRHGFPVNLSSLCSIFGYSYIKIICEFCVSVGWPQACDLWCAALWHGIQNAMGYPHVPDSMMLRWLLTVQPPLRHIHPTEQEGHKTIFCLTSQEYTVWSRNHVTLDGNMSTEECQRALATPPHLQLEVLTSNN